MKDAHASRFVSRLKKFNSASYSKHLSGLISASTTLACHLLFDLFTNIFISYWYNFHLHVFLHYVTKSENIFQTQPSLSNLDHPPSKFTIITCFNSVTFDRWKNSTQNSCKNYDAFIKNIVWVNGNSYKYLYSSLF